MYLAENLFAERIRIEAIIRPGLPVFRITGTNGRSRDREERIRTALLASGIQFPYSTVLVNLSPADHVKDSALLDLPVAVCLLLAIGVPGLRRRLDRHALFLGELSLTGEVCDVPELASWALCSADAGFDNVYLPAASASKLPEGPVHWKSLHHLSDLIEGREEEVRGYEITVNQQAPRPTLEPVLLPERIMRLLMIAAAGKHGLLFVGPPGSGKSVAARLLYDLLPSLDVNEQRRIIRNALLFRDTPTQMQEAVRPLRQPHHSITVAGMVGGGSPLRAGEANRASDGLLLLDELAEYERAVVEALREPIENHEIAHNRNGYAGKLPARFWLVATANPCPCGFHGIKDRTCKCSRQHVNRRRQFLSGPFADRIDLHSVFEKDKCAHTYAPEAIDRIKAKIERAVHGQRARNGGLYNGELTGRLVEDYFQFADPKAERLWMKIREEAPSQRRAAGIRRLARTIADLDEAPSIRAEDLLEAGSYTISEEFWEYPPPIRKIS